MNAMVCTVCCLDEGHLPGCTHCGGLGYEPIRPLAAGDGVVILREDDISPPVIRDEVIGGALEPGFVHEGP